MPSLARFATIAVMAVGAATSLTTEGPTLPAPPHLHAECALPRRRRPIYADFSGRAGNYTLVMVADSGPRRGSRAVGRLTLVATSPIGLVPKQRWLRGYPLHGKTDIPLEMVGAAASGDPAADSVPFPGVLVMQQPLQDRKNASDWAGVRLFLGVLPQTDVTVTTLDVYEIQPSGFSGRWSTFGRPGRFHPAGGHFCANRVPM